MHEFDSKPEKSPIKSPNVAKSVPREKNKMPVSTPKEFKILKQIVKIGREKEKLIQAQPSNESTTPSGRDEKFYLKKDLSEEEIMRIRYKGSSILKNQFDEEITGFFLAYTELMRGIEKPTTLINIEFYRDSYNRFIMAKLYYLMDQSFFEANSMDAWSYVGPLLTEKEKETIMDPKKFYQDYLFYIEKFFCIEKYSRSAQRLSEILLLNPNLLTDPYYVEYRGDFELDERFYEEVMSRQIAVLKNFVDVYGINNELFDLENISKAHGDVIIDIVHQNPDLYGFVQNKKMTNQFKKNMKISDYYSYQKKAMKKTPQNIRDADGRIKFAVNVDIEDWEVEVKELETKLPPQLLYNSKCDALCYFPQKIRGVNLPQLYLKVEGAWTGGHEENVRLRAININHGPGGCYWYTMDAKYVPKFRKIVKEKYGIDIHKDEGLWFGDIELCIKNGIEIQYFVQNPGDIVLLGPGCLHWVRCQEITVNSAWNFCGKDQFQFEQAFERCKINEEIDFKTIIPIKHIGFSLLMQETFSLSPDLRIYLAKMNKEFMTEQNKLMEDFQKDHPEINFRYEPEGYKRHLKSKCKGISLYFYKKFSKTLVEELERQLIFIEKGLPSEDLSSYYNLGSYINSLKSREISEVNILDMKEGPKTTSLSQIDSKLTGMMFQSVKEDISSMFGFSCKETQDDDSKAEKDDFDIPSPKSIDSSEDILSTGISKSLESSITKSNSKRFLEEIESGFKEKLFETNKKLKKDQLVEKIRISEFKENEELINENS